MDPKEALAIVKEIAAHGENGSQAGRSFRSLLQTIRALCIVVSSLLAGTETTVEKHLQPSQKGLSRAKRPLMEYISRVEKEAIWEALQEAGFNKTKAAELLGLTFRQLRYKLEIHQMPSRKRRSARR